MPASAPQKQCLPLPWEVSKFAPPPMYSKFALVSTLKACKGFSYDYRHSLKDGVTRATDGSARQCADTAKTALILSVDLMLLFCLPNVTPLRPAGVLEGVQVETTVSETDIFASSTGNLNIITFVHMKMVNNSAGHFDNEIDSAS